MVFIVVMMVVKTQLELFGRFFARFRLRPVLHPGRCLFRRGPSRWANRGHGKGTQGLRICGKSAEKVRWAKGRSAFTGHFTPIPGVAESWKSLWGTSNAVDPPGQRPWEGPSLRGCLLTISPSHQQKPTETSGARATSVAVFRDPVL